MLAAVVTGGGWANVGAFAAGHLFVLSLTAVFFLMHRYDDHRRIKLVVRKLRPEILWPALILLWALAVTVSQGSSAKFIYFDF